jgi:antitoxin PrlF
MTKRRLPNKSRTTTPKAVPSAFGAQPGDEIVYTIDGNRVAILRAASCLPDDPFAVFTEWTSEADANGYADL